MRTIMKTKRSLLKRVLMAILCSISPCGIGWSVDGDIQLAASVLRALVVVCRHISLFTNLSLHLRCVVILRSPIIFCISGLLQNINTSANMLAINGNGVMQILQIAQFISKRSILRVAVSSLRDAISVPKKRSLRNQARSDG